MTYRNSALLKRVSKPDKSVGEVVVEFFKRRLVNPAQSSRSWDADDETRYQRQFDRPSPHIHSMRNQLSDRR